MVPWAVTNFKLDEIASVVDLRRQVNRQFKKHMNMKDPKARLQHAVPLCCMEAGGEPALLWAPNACKTPHNATDLDQLQRQGQAAVAHVVPADSLAGAGNRGAHVQGQGGDRGKATCSSAVQQCTA